MTSIPGGSPDARHYRLVAEPHHLDDLCRAATELLAQGAAPGLVPAAGALVVALVAGLLGTAAGLPTWTPLAVFLAAFAGIWALLSFRRRRATRAALGATWAAGTDHSTSFDDAGFVARGPRGGIEYRRETIHWVARHRDVVVVRGEGSLLRFLPVELFPDAERAHYPAPPPRAVRAVR